MIFWRRVDIRRDFACPVESNHLPCVSMAVVRNRMPLKTIIYSLCDHETIVQISTLLKGNYKSNR